MKQLTKILFFLIILAVQILAQSQEDYFNNALDQYLDGDYEKALENLNMVTSPEFDVSSLRSQILEKLGRSGETVDNTLPQPQESGDQNAGSSSDDEMYFKAVELFQKGEYAKAKEILLRINSDEIDVTPMLEQIADLLGEHSSQDEISSGGSDEEKYFKALGLYQTGAYREALDILKTISTKEIDTKPLIEQISSLLEKPKLRPAKGEKVDITPFEYQIRKKNKGVKDTAQISHPNVDISLASSGKDSSSMDTFILVLVIGLLIALLVFLWLYYNRQKGSSVGTSKITLLNKTSGKSYNYNKNLISIGRDDTCDIILDDEEVSRRHSEIVFDQTTKSYFITDLNSTNGVIINGKKVNKTRLYSGDNIKIGNQLISVDLD